MPGVTDPTPMDDTLGPYYPPEFSRAFNADLLTPRDGVAISAGDPILLSGMVMDMNRQPVTAALLESWQADSDGRLRDDFGSTRQYVRDGRYAIRTIRPGAMPGVVPRAPHLTLTLFCDGIARLVTQIFLEGEQANATDPLLASLPQALRPRLIAQEDGQMGHYRLDIILRGEGETPFFDDLASGA
jgi:protocatechuate 3,4-dioxygenase, alpha subunit